MFHANPSHDHWFLLSDSELPGRLRGERGLNLRLRAPPRARGGRHQELVLAAPRRDQPPLPRRHHRRLGNSQGAVDVLSTLHHF